MALKLFHPFCFFTYNNVSSTNSKECKLCVHNSFTCNARLLWEKAVSGYRPQHVDDEVVK